MAITGGSAGGHLTALAALTPNEPQWQPGFEDADTSVVAAVPIYGRYDWFTREGSGRPEFIAILQRYIVKKRFLEHRADYLDASPITKVRADAPPRSSCCTAPTTRSSRCRRDARSPRPSRRRRTTRWRMRRSRTPSTPSTSSARRTGDYTATAVAHFLDWVKAKRGLAHGRTVCISMTL